MNSSSTPKKILVSGINIRLVENGRDGLLGWASFVVSNFIKLDNVAIRRGRDGSLFLTYPAKRISGESHQYFHPISVNAANAVQNAVFSRLATLAKAAAEAEANA